MAIHLDSHPARWRDRGRDGGGRGDRERRAGGCEGGRARRSGRPQRQGARDPGRPARPAARARRCLGRRRSDHAHLRRSRGRDAGLRGLSGGAAACSRSRRAPLRPGGHQGRAASPRRVRDDRPLRFESAHAAIGVQDEDGMLVWVPLPPDMRADAASAAAMDAVLSRAGCGARMAVQGRAQALLGPALDGGGQPPLTSPRTQPPCVTSGPRRPMRIPSLRTRRSSLSRWCSPSR